MGTELVAPVLGLVVVCLIGIIGGAFLVSWLKEVLQKEWNKKYKNSRQGKISQKQASDPYSSIHGTVPNIYQCRTCANKILLRGDDTVVELEPSLPDRNDELPNTSRAGQSEYRNHTLINQNDFRGSPNEQKTYRRHSNDTLIDIRSGSPLHGQVIVSQRPTRQGERSSNVQSDNLTRYESVLKNNAARGQTGWAIVRPKDSDDENIPVKGTGMRSSLSWSDLSSSSPHSTNEYPGMKNKLYAVTRNGSSFDQNPLPANKMYHDYKKPDSISYVYDPRQDTLSGRNSPISYEGYKPATQMTNRSKLVEQGSYGGIGGRVPADSAYHAQYQQLKPNNSDPSVIRNRSPNNVSSDTPNRTHKPTKSEINFIDIDNLPLPPPPMDNDEPAFPMKRENLNPRPTLIPSDDEPELPPSYEESINVSNRSTPILTPPTTYC